MLKPDEFINNDNYTILTGNDRFGIQHIAKDGQSLCRTKIKHHNIFELFDGSLLCGKCEKIYKEQIKT